MNEAVSVRSAGLSGTEYDQSMRSFLSQVLLLMAAGIAVTGGVSLWLANSDAGMSSLFHLSEYVEDGKTKTAFTASTFWYAAAGVELLLVILLSWVGLASKVGARVGIPVFVIFAAINGVTLAPMLYAYTTVSVARVFFITAGMFSACAIYGLTTKRDLLPLRTFFFAGLVGLLIALCVNLFFDAPGMDYAISSMAVLLFAGITAFDMQDLRQMHRDAGGYTAGLVVFGSLKLYLDFLNMFVNLMRMFGVKIPGNEG